MNDNFYNFLVATRDSLKPHKSVSRDHKIGTMNIRDHVIT